MTFILIYAPPAVVILAWAVVARRHRRSHYTRLSLGALASVTAMALYAAWGFTGHRQHPVPKTLPPWQDPLVLDLALLGFTAPATVILGAVLAVRGEPKWLCSAIVLASLPLALVGGMSAIAV